MFRSEAQARNQPSAIRLSSIRALDPPQILLVVPQGCLDISVVSGVLADVPLLVDILEVTAKFWPCRIPLLEVEVHIQLTVEELVDG